MRHRAANGVMRLLRHLSSERKHCKHFGRWM